MPPIIVARNLVKRYRALTAVDGVSFDVHPGECFGLLGPNGAGKTTTISMVCAYLPHTGGDLLVDGKDVARWPRQVKSILGVVPQEDDLDSDLTVEQNLVAHARYYGLSAPQARTLAEEALQLSRLADRRRSEVDTLSGGMKRRLAVARALMTRPKVLVVDEPTLGLDPHNRHRIWDLFRTVKDGGTTVLLTTNNMEEAAALCDRLLILDQGRILAQGAPNELIRQHAAEPVLEVRVPSARRQALRDRLTRERLPFYESGSALLVPSRDGATLAGVLSGDGASVVHRDATLEDVFLRLTGRALAEEVDE